MHPCNGIQNVQLHPKHTHIKFRDQKYDRKCSKKPMDSHGHLKPNRMKKNFFNVLGSTHLKNNITHIYWITIDLRYVTCS